MRTTCCGPQTPQTLWVQRSALARDLRPRVSQTVRRRRWVKPSSTSCGPTMPVRTGSVRWGPLRAAWREPDATVLSCRPPIVDPSTRDQAILRIDNSSRLPPLIKRANSWQVSIGVSAGSVEVGADFPPGPAHPSRSGPPPSGHPADTVTGRSGDPGRRLPSWTCAILPGRHQGAPAGGRPRAGPMSLR